MILDVKFSQEYPANVGVGQGFIFDFMALLLYINDLSEMMVIRNIAIHTDETTLSAKCDRAADLLQPCLWIFPDWGRKWLVNFNAGKTSTCFIWLFN